MGYGQILRNIRVSKGITAHWLAKQLNIWPSVITSIEQDKTNPSIQRIERIADILGSSLAEVVRLKNQAEAETPKRRASD